MFTTRRLVAAGLLTSLALGFAFVRPEPVAARAAAATPLAGAYSVDPVHSNVLFKIKHANASWFFGRFGGKDGTIQFDPAAPEKSSVEVAIKLDTVDTGDPARDKHLKSADFFDAAQFPKATFKSKSVAKKGNGFTVTGDFALHGVTKSVSIDMEHTGTGAGMDGEELVGFYGTLALKRSDYGIKAYPEVLGDEVTLMISIEAVAKK